MKTKLSTFSRLMMLLIASALSACTSHDEFSQQTYQSVVACPNFPGLENDCKFDFDESQNYHKEYSEQLLPIHQRQEIIEAELEELKQQRAQRH